MTTLAADMDATQGYIPQTDVSPGFYTLGSELIRVSSERTADRSERGGGQFDSMGTVVSRGIAGTSAAAHSAGVTFTSIQDPSTGGGSGGVTVDNGSDPPAAVTTLVAQGAVISDGSATLPVSLRQLRSEAITFETAGLADFLTVPIRPFSVAGGQVAVGDLIVDIWLDVSEFFDGPDNAVAHLVALDADDAFADLFAVRPDLAFAVVENNHGGLITSLSIADATTGVFSGGVYEGPGAGLLDVRSNNAAGYANKDAMRRVLPATVLNADFAIGFYLSNGTTWTQGSCRIYALVATPAP